MSNLQASRTRACGRSILVLPMTATLTIVVGLALATPAHAQSATGTDAATTAGTQKDKAPGKKAAADTRGALTYDELGATPAIKLPKKAMPSKKQPGPEAKDTKASAQETKAKP